MKLPKNNLDERQELEMLKIEHNGYWLSFWGIFALVLIQCLLGFELRSILSVLALLLIVAVYMIVQELRKGLWDRRLKPNRKTNLAVSAVAGVAVMVFGVVFLACNGYLLDAPVIAAVVIMIQGLVCFGLCFGLLQVLARRVKKTQVEQESAGEE